jgi:hypothetical protein
MQTAALILVGYIGLACAITVLWIGFHWIPTRGHVDRDGRTDSARGHAGAR